VIDSRSPTRAQPLNVAIADHDEAHGVLLTNWLRHAGHRATYFLGSEPVLHALRQPHSFDAFILAWELPEMAAIDLLRVVRTKLGSCAPVVLTSACNQEEDISCALGLGADDYTVKPIREEEFVARLEAIARRCSRAKAPNPAWVEGYHFDSVEHQVIQHSHAWKLTRTEFDLAVLLLSSAGRLISQQEVLTRIWGGSSHVRVHTLQSYVSRLRNKLGLTPANGWRIVSVYGHGYRVQKVDVPGGVAIDDLSPKQYVGERPARNDG